MQTETKGLAVLVAWDGSPASATAFPLARVIAERLGATLQILYVHPPGKVDPALLKELRLAADKLDGAEFRIRAGDAATEIMKATEEEDVALIVLTTHGRVVEARRGMGHVAEEVVRRTRRPVFLVNPEVALGRPPNRLGRILLPLDGTPKTAVALRPATELAEKLGAELDLLYVASPDQAVPSERGSMVAPRYVDQAQHEWPQWTQEAIRRLAQSCAGCPPSVKTRMFLAQGDIGEEITRFANQHGAEAVVLVRRSRLQPGRARVLRAVLKAAPCPILILGGPED